MLEERVGDHGHGRMTMESLPGSSLEVIETEFLFQLLMRLLYGFVILRLDRRDLVWIGVTTNPTAEWVARQITEAFLG